jgi:DNA-binding CsgD family transcriptional regulator
LNEHDDRTVVRIAIDIADSQIADRLAGLLGGAEGIELVGDRDGADVVVVLPRAADHDDDVGLALTPRELEVLALLAEGASNKMIARRLGISAHTAKFHVGSLIDKLDAISRTDAVAHAARLGVIEL